MNPYKHAEISVAKRGGSITDYYPIHSFIDSTKELCSDNRHRILHNLWAVRRIIIPIFGPTLVNSDGRQVNTKDLCEQDHILPDYGMKFIPTLGDFVAAMDDLSAKEVDQINETYRHFQGHKAIRDLMISPLNNTGELKSLRITHNTWFCNEIIPKIYGLDPILGRIGIPTLQLYEQLNFETWMDNGHAFPPSTTKVSALL